jgi:hypothetical protein
MRKARKFVINTRTNGVDSMKKGTIELKTASGEAGSFLTPNPWSSLDNILHEATIAVALSVEKGLALSEAIVRIGRVSEAEAERTAALSILPSLVKPKDF